MNQDNSVSRIVSYRRLAFRRRFMKLFAILQILLLVGTSLLPEGPYLRGPSSQCANGCGCTAETRRAGQCCCTRRQTASCCDKSAASKSCNSKRAPGRSCCSTRSKSAATGTPKSRRYAKQHRTPKSPNGLVSGCPCGGPSPGLHLLHMPRDTPDYATLLNGYSFCAPLVVSNDVYSPFTSLPPTPPPKIRVHSERDA